MNFKNSEMYYAPEVEVVEAMVEAGFSQSEGNLEDPVVDIYIQGWL